MATAPLKRHSAQPLSPAAVDSLPVAETPPKIRRATKDIVEDWALEITHSAPPRQQLDFAEYMKRRLPDLIAALDGN